MLRYWKSNEGSLQLAHLVSTLGERLSFTTLIVLFSKLHNVDIGPLIVLMLYSATFVLAYPISIIILRRVQLTRISLVSDVLRAMLLAGYCFYPFLSPVVAKYFLFFLVFLNVGVTAVARAAFWALVPKIVPAEALQRINRNLSWNETIGLTFGTFFGGLVYVKFGAVVVFGFDAITYLLSFFLLLRLFKSTPKSSEHSEVTSNSAASLSFLKESSFLASTLAAAFVLSLQIGFVSGTMVTFIQKKFSLPSEYIGYVYGVSALGSFFGAAFTTNIQQSSSDRIKPFVTVLFVILVGILFFYGHVYSTMFFVSMICLASSSAATSFSGTILSTLAMKACAPSSRPSYAAVNSMLSRFVMMLGNLISYFVLSRFEILHAVTIFQAVTLIALFLWVLRQKGKPEYVQF